MVEKEEHTITLLLCLHLLTLVLVCCVDTDIDIINKTIDEIAEVQAEQNESYWHLSEDVETRLNEIDGRIADLEWENKVQEYRLDLHSQKLDDNAQMFSSLLDSTERLEEHMRSLPDNVLGLDISEEDEYLIAQLLYLEAGADWCSYELQKAVVSVFFNHMVRYGRNVQQAVYYPGAFSVASRAKYYTPSARCRMAVRDVLENGLTMPSNVLLFQTGGFHTEGRPYCRIQNVYFSTM